MSAHDEILDLQQRMGDQMWTFVPAQQVLGKFLASFKEFPQRQPIGSLRVEKVLKQMESSSPHGN